MDVDVLGELWLVRDYLPEVLQAHAAEFPSIDYLLGALPQAREMPLCATPSRESDSSGKPGLESQSDRAARCCNRGRVEPSIALVPSSFFEARYKTDSNAATRTIAVLPTPSSSSQVA
jgi:hypothetical protein